MNGHLARNIRGAADMGWPLRLLRSAVAALADDINAGAILGDQVMRRIGQAARRRRGVLMSAAEVSAAARRLPPARRAS